MDGLLIKRMKYIPFDNSAIEILALFEIVVSFTICPIEL
jgi:hypothetical protein